MPGRLQVFLEEGRPEDVAGQGGLRGGVTLARQSLFNLVHYDTVVKVDCIVRKRAAYRQEEFKRKRAIEVEGQRIWVVSPEDLILSKLHWARDSLSELQLGDVRNILEAVSALDWSYVERWARELGIEPLLEKVKR